jgi:hypothetical protein
MFFPSVDFLSQSSIVPELVIALFPARKPFPNYSEAKVKKDFPAVITKNGAIIRIASRRVKLQLP